MQKFIGIQNGNPQEILRVAEVEATLWVEVQTTDLRIPGDVYLVEQDHQDNIVGWCYLDGSWKKHDKFLGQGWFSFTEETSSKIMGIMTIRHSLSPLHAECKALILVMECMKILQFT